MLTKNDCGKMLTEKDYEEMIEDSFEMYGKKWFPHRAYDNSSEHGWKYPY